MSLATVAEPCPRCGTLCRLKPQGRRLRLVTAAEHLLELRLEGAGGLAAVLEHHGPNAAAVLAEPLQLAHEAHPDYLKAAIGSGRASLGRLVHRCHQGASLDPYGMTSTAAALARTFKPPTRRPPRKKADAKPTGRPCRSCGGEVRWVSTKARKAMPCDLEFIKIRIRDGGPVVVVTLAGDVFKGDEVAGAGAAEGYAIGLTSHFKSCPEAGQWRNR